VRTYDRTLKRLLKEVVKIKDVLSANKNMHVKLGELQDYVTLQTTVERKEFEDAGAEFFAKVMVPVNDVLAKAGMTVD
jgi:hypoxia up-regulated 1